MKKLITQKITFFFGIIFISIILSIPFMIVFNIIQRQEIDSYIKQQKQIVEYIAENIDSEKHNFIDKQKDQNNALFQTHRNNLNLLKDKIKTVKYMYTLSYHKNMDGFTYTIDAGKTDKNTIRLETNNFALIIYKENGILKVNYEDEIQQENFSIKIGKKKYNIEIINDYPNKIIINNKEILKLTNTDLFITETENGTLGPNKLELDKPIILDDIEIYVSISIKGMSTSNPGTKYIENDKILNKIKEGFIRGKTFSLPIHTSIYGKTITTFGIIKNGLGIPTGLVGIDTSVDEIKKMKNNSFGTFLLLYIMSCVINFGILYLLIFHTKNINIFINKIKIKYE